jgi:hypothetical protein
MLFCFSGQCNLATLPAMPDKNAADGSQKLASLSGRVRPDGGQVQPAGES